MKPADYIASLSGKHPYTQIKPITLTIKEESWEGVEYHFEGKYESDMMAVTRGDKQAGDSYHETRYLFQGKLPKGYLKKRGKIAYMDGGRTLYVSGYLQDPKVVENHKEQNPFGISFMLHEWPDSSGPIDSHEIKKYDRIPIDFQRQLSNHP